MSTQDLRNALRLSLRTMEGLQTKLHQMAERHGMNPGFDDLDASRRFKDLAESIAEVKKALGIKEER